VARLYDEHDRRMGATSSVHEGRARSAAAPGQGSGGLFTMPRFVILLGIVVVGAMQFTSTLNIGSTGTAVTGALSQAGETIRIPFGRCGLDTASNCISDSGSILFQGSVVMLDDVTLPRAIGAACPAERKAGMEAAARLLALLNKGPVTVDRGPVDANTPGRRYATISRNGVSIGQMLKAEGLARGPGASGWCA
jgi:micrococcal nuclease